MGLSRRFICFLTMFIGIIGVILFIVSMDKFRQRDAKSGCDAWGNCDTDPNIDFQPTEVFERWRGHGFNMKTIVVGSAYLNLDRIVFNPGEIVFGIIWFLDANHSPVSDVDSIHCSYNVYNALNEIQQIYPIYSYYVNGTSSFTMTIPKSQKGGEYTIKANEQNAHGSTSTCQCMPSHQLKSIYAFPANFSVTNQRIDSGHAPHIILDKDSYFPGDVVTISPRSSSLSVDGIELTSIHTTSDSSIQFKLPTTISDPSSCFASSAFFDHFAQVTTRSIQINSAATLKIDINPESSSNLIKGLKSRVYMQVTDASGVGLDYYASLCYRDDDADDHETDIKISNSTSTELFMLSECQSFHEGRCVFNEFRVPWKSPIFFIVLSSSSSSCSSSSSIIKQIHLPVSNQGGVMLIPSPVIDSFEELTVIASASPAGLYSITISSSSSLVVARRLVLIKSGESSTVSFDSDDFDDDDGVFVVTMSYVVPIDDVKLRQKLAMLNKNTKKKTSSASSSTMSPSDAISFLSSISSPLTTTTNADGNTYFYQLAVAERLVYRRQLIVPIADIKFDDDDDDVFQTGQTVSGHVTVSIPSFLLSSSSSSVHASSIVSSSSSTRGGGLVRNQVPRMTVMTMLADAVGNDDGLLMMMDSVQLVDPGYDDDDCVYDSLRRVIKEETVAGQRSSSSSSSSVAGFKRSVDVLLGVQGWRMLVYQYDADELLNAMFDEQQQGDNKNKKVGYRCAVTCHLSSSSLLSKMTIDDGGLELLESGFSLCDAHTSANITNQSTITNHIALYHASSPTIIINKPFNSTLNTMTRLLRRIKSNMMAYQEGGEMMKNMNFRMGMPMMAAQMERGDAMELELAADAGAPVLGAEEGGADGFDGRDDLDQGGEDPHHFPFDADFNRDGQFKIQGDRMAPAWFVVDVPVERKFAYKKNKDNDNKSKLLRSDFAKTLYATLHDTAFNWEREIAGKLSLSNFLSPQAIAKINSKHSLSNSKLDTSVSYITIPFQFDTSDELGEFRMRSDILVSLSSSNNKQAFGLSTMIDRTLSVVNDFSISVKLPSSVVEGDVVLAPLSIDVVPASLSRAIHSAIDKEVGKSDVEEMVRLSIAAQASGGFRGVALSLPDNDNSKKHSKKGVDGWDGVVMDEKMMHDLLPAYLSWFNAYCVTDVDVPLGCSGHVKGSLATGDNNLLASESVDLSWISNYWVSTRNDHIIVDSSFWNIKDHVLLNLYSVLLPHKQRIVESKSSSEDETMKVIVSEYVSFSASIDSASNTGQLIVGDGVRHEIHIAEKGFPVEISETKMMTITDKKMNDKDSMMFELGIDNNADISTLKIIVSPLHSPRGKLLKAVEKLINMPCGCFEQTASTSYPLTLALSLLESPWNRGHPSDPRMQSVYSKGKSYLSEAVSRLLSYEVKSTPGGFEWFGNEPAHETLTSYGLLQFIEIRANFPELISSDVIDRTTNYLLSRKNDQGGFSVSSRQLDSFGGSPPFLNDVYIVYALLESGAVDESKLTKEIKAIKQQCDNILFKDSYMLGLSSAIMTMTRDFVRAKSYALRVAAHQDSRLGMVKGSESSITMSSGDDLTIETTAVAVLAWLQFEKSATETNKAFVGNVELATRWLVSRCEDGLFGSTQATILSLKAIIMYDSMRRSGTGDVLMHVKLVPSSDDGDVAKTGAHSILTGGPVDFVDFIFNPEGGGHANSYDVTSLILAKLSSSSSRQKRFQISISLSSLSHGPEFSMPVMITATYSSSMPIAAPALIDSPFVLTMKTRLAMDVTEFSSRNGNPTYKIIEGEAVSLSVEVSVKRISDVQHNRYGIPMVVGVIGIPAGLSLDETSAQGLVKSKAIAMIETTKSEAVIYWYGIKEGETKKINLILKAHVPGVYTARSSRAFGYYSGEICWVEGITVFVVPMGM